MKRIPEPLAYSATFAVLFLSMMFGMAACTPTVNPPTAPPIVGAGYINIDDQRFQQAIGSAETFYLDTQNNVNAKILTPSPTTLTALNAFGIALTQVRQLVLNYHNSPTAAKLATTNTAVTNLTSSQNSLTAQITGGK